MKRRMIWFAALGGIVLATISVRLAQSRPSLPQDPQLAARCMAMVPKEWGEYVGASSYGVVFKDDAGTLRFVTQFSCGLEAAPHLAMTIQRK